jgi:hypothetical protein
MDGFFLAAVSSLRVPLALTLHYSNLPLRLNCDADYYALEITMGNARSGLLRTAALAGLTFLFLLSPTFAAVQAAPAGSDPATSYVAPLSAAPGITTSATGDAFFWLAPNGTALEYVVVVSNITNAFMAHIHLSPSGDILVWLAPNPNTAASGEEASCVAVLSGGPASACAGLISGSFSGVLGQGTITAADLSGSNTCAACDNVTFAQLMTDIQAGNAYVNVHTSQNPAGEIQGTIVPVTGIATPVPEFGTSALFIALFGSMAVVALLTRFQLGVRRRKQDAGP